MADHYTLLNGASVAGGDYVDMESITYGGAPTTRKRTRTVISGTVAAAIADVTNTEPAASVYALPVRYPGLITEYADDSFYALPVKPAYPRFHSDTGLAQALWHVGAYGRHGGGALSANKVSADEHCGLYADRFGRLATVHADAGSVLWKANSYTTTQTGTTWWAAPGATARLVLTHLVVAIGGTTGGRVTVWFGIAADTTYTEGTDQVVLDVETIPSATRTEFYPLAVGNAAIYGPLNSALKITTSGNITVRISGYGYMQDET